MNRLRLYIFSGLCLTLLILSNNKAFMTWWADKRITLGALHTRTNFGDLYSSCFISRFIDTSFHKKLTTYKTKINNNDVYIIHDSYLARPLKKENFIGVDSLIMSDFRAEGKNFNLRKGKENILIIESAERNVDWRFSDTVTIFSKLYAGKTRKIAANEKQPLFKILFNPLISRNIEFNLFDYGIFRPIKEFKADMNFDLFNKTPSDVASSYDKKYLFLGGTVERYNTESSFKKIPQEEILRIVESMNRISDHYKSLGFDKVYFSIVPNPVSILEPWRRPYNYKAERIRDCPSLRCGVIDVCYSFSHTRKQIYRRDDSHWNDNGLQLWLNEVNSTLFLFK